MSDDPYNWLALQVGDDPLAWLDATEHEGHDNSPFASGKCRTFSDERLTSNGSYTYRGVTSYSPPAAFLGSTASVFRQGFHSPLRLPGSFLPNVSLASPCPTYAYESNVNYGIPCTTEQQDVSLAVPICQNGEGSVEHPDHLMELDTFSMPRQAVEGFTSLESTSGATDAGKTQRTLWPRTDQIGLDMEAMGAFSDLVEWNRKSHQTPTTLTSRSTIPLSYRSKASRVARYLELGYSVENSSTGDTQKQALLSYLRGINKSPRISEQLKEVFPEEHVTRSQDSWKFCELREEETTARDILWILSNCNRDVLQDSLESLSSVISEVLVKRILGTWLSVGKGHYRKQPYFRTVSKTDRRELDNLNDKLQRYGRKEALRGQDLDKTRIILSRLKAWLRDELARLGGYSVMELPDGEIAEVLGLAEDAFGKLMSRADELYPWV